VAATTHGYCLKCRARCGVMASIDNGRLTRIDPDPAHPNAGICAMGRAEADVTTAADRLRVPLRRTTPKDQPARYEEVSWDEALDEVAERLRAIAAEDGPEAVAFSRPTSSANASADWGPYFGRLANRFGTPNQLLSVYLCNWNRDHGVAQTLGRGLPAADIEQAAVVLVLGHNPAVTNPQLMGRLRMAQARGAQVVVVDPRRTETARFADLWLAPRYGTDGALVLGAIRHLLHTGSYDATFLARWTNAGFLVDRRTGRLVRDAADGTRFAVLGADGGPRLVDPAVDPSRWGVQPALTGELRADDPRGADLHPRPDAGADVALDLVRDAVEPYDRPQVAALTGIPVGDLRRFDELVAGAGSLAYSTWNGWEQHTNSFHTHRAMAVLLAVTGNVDRPGGNVWRASLDLPDLDGASWLTASQQAKRLGLEQRPLGAPRDHAAAPAFYRAVLQAVPYRLRALVSFGANPLLQAPDVDLGREAFRALEFHVHVDLFPTPVAEFADLVLPAAALWESPGLKLGFEGGSETRRHVQYRPAATSPPGLARPDQEIVFDLARRLGYGASFWDGDLEASYEARLAPLGLTLADLRAAPAGIMLDEDPDVGSYDAQDAAGKVRGFTTATGKVELYAEALLAAGHPPLPHYAPPRSAVTGDAAAEATYPLVLTSRKLPAIAHSQHRGLARLRRRWPEPFVEVHPTTAGCLGLRDGEPVVVESPTGAMHVRLRLSDRVPPDAVVGHAGWWEACEELNLPGQDPFSDTGANFNRLVGTEVTDEVSGGVPVKSARCRLRAAHPAPVS